MLVDQPDRDKQGQKKTQRARNHGARPDNIAERTLADDLPVNVEADRLVLRLLDRMPKPQRREGGIALGDELLLISQQQLGENGGEMFERAGDGKPYRLGSEALS